MNRSVVGSVPLRDKSFDASPHRLMVTRIFLSKLVDNYFYQDEDVIVVFERLATSRHSPDLWDIRPADDLALTASQTLLPNVRFLPSLWEVTVKRMRSFTVSSLNDAFNIGNLNGVQFSRSAVSGACADQSMKLQLGHYLQML